MIRQFSFEINVDCAEAMALAILDGVDLCRETGTEVSIVKLPTTYIASDIITQADALEYQIPIFVSPKAEAREISGGNLVNFTSSHEKAKQKA